MIEQTQHFFVTLAYLLWAVTSVGLALFYRWRYKRSIKRLHALTRSDSTNIGKN